MVSVLPVEVEHIDRPQGHGYVRASIDRENAFFDPGTALTGHEFHYTRLMDTANEVPTVMKVERGIGIGNGRDGISVANLVATYTHFHASGAPLWAPRVVEAVRRGGR